MAEEFSYVIARLWKDTEPDNLCIYTYGTEIQCGDEESARALLSYVNNRNKDKKYSIYKINYTKVD